MSYTGGPEPFSQQVWRLFAPRGGAIADGARLAALNMAGVIAALVLLALASLVNRAINLVIGLPFAVTAAILVVALVAAGGVLWYRYATLHARAARQTSGSPRPDVVGGVAGLPFTAIAFFLLVTALLRLLFAIISFSGDRLIDALRQGGLAVFFFALAAANIVIARVASSRESR